MNYPVEECIGKIVTVYREVRIKDAIILYILKGTLMQEEGSLYLADGNKNIKLMNGDQIMQKMGEVLKYLFTT